MNHVLGGIGKSGLALPLALLLSLSIGCSSQQGAADDAGVQCGLIADQVPIQAQTGAVACVIFAPIPTPAIAENIRVQDQSMVTIPHTTRDGDGWTFLDVQATVTLVGSYCVDAMAGKITAVSILVACPGHPIP